MGVHMRFIRSKKYSNVDRTQIGVGRDKWNRAAYLNSLRNLWVLILFCGAVLFMTLPAAAQTPEASPVAGDSSTEAAAPSEPVEVAVGFYLTSIYGLDQQTSTYYADFYMWMRWQGEIDPTASVEFLNNIERWGLTMTPLFEEPMILPSGESLAQFHVQGQFFQPLLLENYPLDNHGLTIEIEDGRYADTQLVYVLDTAESGIAPNVKLPGWNVSGWNLTSAPHTYLTGFGEEGLPEQHYSTAKFTLEIDRPESFFTWKLLLPLVIVLLLGCSVLLIHPSFTEVRLAGPATALLTLVFLQQSYTSSLPDNGSLVLLDKIYALAYALVIGLIGTTIITSHWIRVDPDGNAARATRVDRIASIGLFACFLAGTAILVAVAV